MENSRRRFFKNAGAGALGLTVSSSLFPGDLLRMDKVRTADNKADDLFQIAIAGWSFVKFKLEPSLEMMNRVNVKNLCIKSYHLALDSSPEQIAAFWDQLKTRGITGYGVGPIYMKTEKEVDAAFDYAKRVGVKLIVGVPEHELLPYVSRKVKEYDFHYAIHNHGLEDKRYPTVESIYERIKDLDTRLGICHDIGYSIQMGFDPAAVTLRYGHRVYEMHVKDMVNIAGTWTDCEIGRGAIDFAALVKALRKTRYSGMCSIENEKNSADPLPGLAESVGYFKAVIKLT
jgi:sugar phosphate isomerase/epimerase